jgi:exosortase
MLVRLRAQRTPGPAAGLGAAATDTPSLRAWPSPTVQASVLGILCLALYYPALQGLVRAWLDDPNYSHGFLIPLLSAYFVWERRDRLRALSREPSAWGLALLLAGLLAFSLGRVGAGAFLLRTSLIGVILGLILFLLGSRAFRLCLLPIGFLALMIPLPTVFFVELTLPLQLLAAQLATFLLQTLAIPVLREGNVIFLAHTTLEVVEACSGIRSLVSLVTLAIVFSYFTQRSLWKRCLLTVSAVPIAIVANTLRIAGTGLLAQFLGRDAAEGFYHTFSGLLLFGIALLLLLLEGLVLSRLSRKPA